MANMTSETEGHSKVLRGLVIHKEEFEIDDRTKVEDFGHLRGTYQGVWRKRQISCTIVVQKVRDVKTIEQELCHLIAMKHESIFKFYGISYGEDNEPHLVYEGLQDIRLSLYDCIHKGSTDYTVYHIFQWALQTASAVEYLRHLKSQPVLFPEISPDRLFVSTTDMLTLKMQVLYSDLNALPRPGPAEWVAPELRDSSQLQLTDESADVYHIGVLFYESLTKIKIRSEDNIVINRELMEKVLERLKDSDFHIHQTTDSWKSWPDIPKLLHISPKERPTMEQTMDVFRKELSASEKMLRAMKLDTSKVSLLTEDAADADREMVNGAVNVDDDSAVRIRPPKKGMSQEQLQEEEEEKKIKTIQQKRDLQRNIQSFNKMSINKGRCYATKDFAAGEFNAKDGGVLKFKDRDDIKLVILPDALSGSQRVYMKLMPDPLDGGANFSPVVECGPPGLNFQKPIELTFPHTADIEDGGIADTDLAIRSRDDIGDQWNVDGQVKVLRYTDDTITLAVSHFSGFRLSLKSGKGKKRKPVNKRLDLAVFTHESTVKVWIIAEDKYEKGKIERKEDRRRYNLADWQGLLFPPDLGSLVMERRVFGGTVCQKFATMDEDQVFGLGTRCHKVKLESPQETEILFSREHNSDQLNKLQIVAHFEPPLPQNDFYTRTVSTQESSRDSLEEQELVHPRDESLQEQDKQENLCQIEEVNNVLQGGLGVRIESNIDKEEMSNAAGQNVRLLEMSGDHQHHEPLSVVNEAIDQNGNIPAAPDKGRSGRCCCCTIL